MICSFCGDDISEGLELECCGMPFHASSCYEQHVSNDHDGVDGDN